MNFGYTYENEWSKSLKNARDLGYKFWYNKLVDTKALDYSIRCQACGAKVYHNLILPKSISDWIIVNSQNTNFLENKSSKNKTSYPLVNIAPHQLKWGMQLHGYAHTNYHFAIHNRHKKGDYRTWILSAWELDDLIETVYPRKSIKWEYFENYLELDRAASGQAWSIFPYLDLILEKKEETE